MSKLDNSGTLGANKRKEKDTHPSHTGQCQIDGVDYWISAWVKEGDNGRFFSLSFKKKEARGGRADPRPKSDEESEIPF
jgi:hypothetical protein